MYCNNWVDVNVGWDWRQARFVNGGNEILLQKENFYCVYDIQNGILGEVDFENKLEVTETGFRFEKYHFFIVTVDLGANC